MVISRVACEPFLSLVYSLLNASTFSHIIFCCFRHSFLSTTTYYLNQCSRFNSCLLLPHSPAECPPPLFRFEARSFILEFLWPCFFFFFHSPHLRHSCRLRLGHRIIRVRACVQQAQDTSYISGRSISRV